MTYAYVYIIRGNPSIDYTTSNTKILTMEKNNQQRIMRNQSYYIYNRHFFSIPSSSIGNEALKGRCRRFSAITPLEMDHPRSSHIRKICDPYLGLRGTVSVDKSDWTAQFLMPSQDCWRGPQVASKIGTFVLQVNVLALSDRTIFGII